MDSEDNNNVAGTSSERRCGKTTKRNSKSEAEQQGCPSDLQNQPHEAKKERWRLDVPNDCRQRLSDLSKGLNLRSMGAAVSWMLPSDMHSLIDLTKGLGYEKGGDAIDWLISMGDRMLTLTRELGLQNCEETLDYLISMAPSIVPGRKEIQPEQFQKPTFQHPGGAEDARSSSKQQPVVLERIRQRPAFGDSAANNSIPPLTLPENIATGSLYPGSEIFSSTVNAQPHHQFQSSVHLVGEKQQGNQFRDNSSGLQGERTTNNSFGRNRGIPNLSNNFQRRGIDLRRTQLQTAYTIDAKGKEPINQAGNTAPVQALRNTTVDAVDVGYDQGFQNGYLAEMPLEIQLQNNTIQTGDRLQQNHANQYFNPRALNQVFINFSMDPRANQGIPPQYEFENTQGWNQYQNQAGTQMGGNHERHGRTP